jgi:hypothetical protein
MHSQRVREFLTDGMYSLMPQAQRLMELRRIAAGALPGNLLRSCSIANYKQGKVVIFAENSAVAAKLKLLAPTLRDHFLKSAIEITGIDVEVQPTNPVPEPPAKHTHLSSGAAQALAELADQLPDSKLKSSINALAGQSVSKR